MSDKDSKQSDAFAVMRRVHYMEMYINDYDRGVEVEKAFGNPAELTERNLNDLQLPQGCFGFRLFDRYEGLFMGEKVSSGRVDESTLFLIGDVMPHEQVKRLGPDAAETARKMEISESVYAVKCKDGPWHVIEPGDSAVIVLLPEAVTWV